MRDVHEQLHSLGAPQPQGECLGGSGLEGIAHALDGDEQRRQLRVGDSAFRPAPHHLASQLLQEMATDAGPHSLVNDRRGCDLRFDDAGRENHHEIGNLRSGGRLADPLSPLEDDVPRCGLQNCGRTANGAGVVRRRGSPGLTGGVRLTSGHRLL